MHQLALVPKTCECEDLPRGHAKVKVIVVVRNPNTVVSLYHHAKANGIWLHWRLRLFRHLFSWQSRERFLVRSCPGVAYSVAGRADSHLFLHYEDMYDNLEPVIRKIVTH